MRILLDSHIFLWLIAGEQARLTARVLERLRDPAMSPLLSVASVWELVLKASRGRLVLPAPVADFLSAQLAANRAALLPVEVSHLRRLEILPWHHRDPFDRMLVAQAQAEDVPLVSTDPLLRRYDVRVLW